MDTMNVVETISSDVFKRITVVSMPERDSYFYIYDILNEDGKLNERWIQDWNCLDITDDMSPTLRSKLYNFVDNFYKK